MTPGAIASLIGLAAADSLNPFSIAAQAYLLGTPKPMARSLVFLLTTFVVCLAGGVLLWQGADAFARDLVRQIPAGWVPWINVALGLLLIGFGLYSARQARRGKAIKPPRNLTLPATFLFALAAGASDLPTALPLFGAVGILTSAGTALMPGLLMLVLYSLVYCAPLIALVVVRSSLSEERSRTTFEWLSGWVDWALTRLLPPLCILGGAALCGFAGYQSVKA